VPQDHVRFGLKDQKSAGELQPSAGDEHEEYRYVVMPMRI
jgi:DNA polymerase III sliding clamp (beta) subunit (PCNA family)